MVELDGIEYKVQVPSEVANDLVTYINQYCSDNHVVNSKGEQIYIDVNPMNPFYILCYGIGYLVGILQRLIYSVGCSLSLASSSDRQLLNLAQMCNIKRRPASYTTVNINVFSSLTAACRIPPMAPVTVVTGGRAMTFHSSNTSYVYIPEGQTQRITLIADEMGAFTVPEGAITAFDNDISNLRLIKSDAAVPGRPEETVAELRKRIQKRSEISSSIIRVQDALSALPGITLCNVYFNFNPTGETIIGGVTVKPRQALLVIQGYNAKIAETYFRYMTAETAGKDQAGVQYQSYITHAHQSIYCYYIAPQQTRVYVRVYINKFTGDDSVRQAIRDEITAMCSRLLINADISSADITQTLLKAFPGLDVEHADLSTDNISFDYKIVGTPDRVLSVASEDIKLIET